MFLLITRHPQEISILNTPNKAIRLLFSNTLTPWWKRGLEMWKEVLFVIKFVMNPHRGTRTGDDAMTTSILQGSKICKRYL